MTSSCRSILYVEIVDGHAHGSQQKFAEVDIVLGNDGVVLKDRYGDAEAVLNELSAARGMTYPAIA